jgi:hypothetical protein
MYLSISAIEKLQRLLKQMSECLSGTVLHILLVYIFNTFFVSYSPNTGKVVRLNSNTWRWFLPFVYVFSIFYLLTWSHLFFLMWWSLNYFINFESIDGELNPSPAVICVALVSLLMLKLVIRAVSFHHSLLNPSRHNPSHFDFGL